MVTVTDMDAIELSNLNRQFLFRERHLKQMKSQVAARAAKEMNSEMNLQAWITRVAPETENVYNAVFWEGLTGMTWHDVCFTNHSPTNHRRVQCS